MNNVKIKYTKNLWQKNLVKVLEILSADLFNIHANTECILINYDVQKYKGKDLYYTKLFNTRKLGSIVEML